VITHPEEGAGSREQAVSEETAFVLEPHEARLLVEVGFLAAGAGDVKRADTIFTALQALRPGRAYPLIGQAVALMNAGRAHEAVARMEQARGADAVEQSQIDAWHGLALQLSGHAGQGRRVLEQAASQGQGEGRMLARGLLGLEAENTGGGPARPEGQEGSKQAWK